MCSPRPWIIDGLQKLLRGIADGSIRCVAVDTPVPSQFSHEILNANPYAYLDDAPLEERRARAVEMRRMLPESVLEEVGKLDPAAIEQVQEEAGRMCATPTNCTMCCIRWSPCRKIARDLGSRTMAVITSSVCVAAGRAIVASNASDGRPALLGGGGASARAFSALFPKRNSTKFPADDENVSALSRRCFARSGHRLDGAPRADHSRCRSADRSVLPASEIKGASSHGSDWAPSFAETLLERLRAARFCGANSPITKSRRSNGASGVCWRAFIASPSPLCASRSSRSRQRSSCAGCCAGSTLRRARKFGGERGDAGSSAAVAGIRNSRQCVGAADSARRIADYDPEVARPTLPDWRGGLGTVVAASGDARRQSAAGKRRVIPTSVAPITFFVREDADWMTPQHPGSGAAGERAA